MLKQLTDNAFWLFANPELLVPAGWNNPVFAIDILLLKYFQISPRSRLNRESRLCSEWFRMLNGWGPMQ